MSVELWIGVGLVLAWIVIARVVLPRLGIQG